MWSQEGGDHLLAQGHRVLMKSNGYVMALPSSRAEYSVRSWFQRRRHLRGSQFWPPKEEKCLQCKLGSKPCSLVRTPSQLIGCTGLLDGESGALNDFLLEVNYSGMSLNAYLAIEVIDTPFFRLLGSEGWTGCAG